MLATAQRLADQGVDVAVGVVETHRRAKTERMLLGLDIIPSVQVEHRGARTGSGSGTAAGGVTALHEFDVDAAVRRRLQTCRSQHMNCPEPARRQRISHVPEWLSVPTQSSA